MNNINISLENLEYSLIKNNCEYFYGFKDEFLKYNKNDLFLKFAKIAEDLENQKLISRSFSGQISYNEDFKKILDTIIKVKNFYEITYIVNGSVARKFKIYNNDEDNVIIKILSDNYNELDNKNMELLLTTNDDLLFKFKNFCENEKIKTPPSVLNDEICVCNDYLEKIKKTKEKEYTRIINEFKYSCNEIIEKLNKAICNPIRLISILKTNMQTRKSKLVNYLYDLNSLLKMNFKIDGENHNWIVNEISSEMLLDEYKNLILM